MESKDQTTEQPADQPPKKKRRGKKLPTSLSITELDSGVVESKISEAPESIESTPEETKGPEAVESTPTESKDSADTNTITDSDATRKELEELKIALAEAQRKAEEAEIQNELLKKVTASHTIPKYLKIWSEEYTAEQKEKRGLTKYNPSMLVSELLHQFKEQVEKGDN